MRAGRTRAPLEGAAPPRLAGSSGLKRCQQESLSYSDVNVHRELTEDTLAVCSLV